MEGVYTTSIASTPAEPDGAHLRKASFLDGFRRITSSGQFIPEIDGIRFIAVMLILVYHVLVFVYGVRGLPITRIETLARGVEMFFVLSGFVLAIPFAAARLRGGKPVVLKQYLLRRLTRLEPPYLVCMVIYTFLKVIQYPNIAGVLLRNALLGSVYLHDAIIGRPGIVISVAWSLEVEVQFYLLMPLLAYVFSIRPTWLRRSLMLGAALGISSVQLIWFPALEMRNDGHLLNFIQYFLAGMMLADVWVMEWGNAPPPLAPPGRLMPSWGDVIWLVVAPAIVLYPGSDLDRLLLAPVIFLLYLAIFRGCWIRRLMRVQLLTVIGGMCYSIYLLHNLIIVSFGAWWRSIMPGSFWGAITLSMLLMVPLCLIVSAAYFRLIERPCMRRDWPQRFWGWLMSHLFVDEQEPSKSA